MNICILTGIYSPSDQSPGVSNQHMPIYDQNIMIEIPLLYIHISYHIFCILPLNSYELRPEIIS